MKSKITRAQRNKRLQILKDAKEIILSNGAIEPRSRNAYLRIIAREPEFDSNEVANWRLKERYKQFDTSVLKNSKKTVCQVCALGALFLADIDRNNHATVRDIVDLHSRDQIEERLKNLFTADELQAIEAVFENMPGAYIDAPGLYDVVRGYAYSSVDDDGDVLLRILDFLIENDSIVI